MLAKLLATADRKLYETLRNYLVRRAARAPRWFVAAKAPMRALRLVADVLPVVLDRGDVPKYLRPMLESIAEGAAQMSADYRRHAEECLASPVFCARCGAPAQNVTESGCSRCLRPTAQA